MGDTVNRFERFLFRGVPVWLVALLGVLAFVAMVAFGNIAVHAYKGGRKAGAVGDAVLALSTIPALIDRIQNGDRYLRIRLKRFDDRAGFTFAYPPGSRPEAGYLLISIYDGDLMRPVLSLWDLNAQTMVHQWRPPIDEIIARSVKFTSNEVVLKRDRTENRLTYRHPLMMENGDLVLKMDSPLFRVDPCNEIVWINDRSLFHHATEKDADGNIWVSSRIDPTRIPHVNFKDFLDDAITQVSPDGEILFQRSVAEVLIQQGLARLVYGRDEYISNPVHLNDNQPVDFDGPYWKKGDVFLSLRNNSMIALYRPSEDRIVWYKEGPWDHQHDVDVLDDHRISVFDNNASQGYPIDWIEGGHSDVMIYDFATDTVTTPWADAFARLEIRSETEGLQTIRASGELLVEEQNSGRFLSIGPDGNVLWEYINRAGKDGSLYRIIWSRFYEPGTGARIVEAIREKTGSCPAG